MVVYAVWFYMVLGFSVLRFSTVLYRSLQFSTVLYRSLPFSTVLYRSLQFSTVLYSSLQFSTVLGGLVLGGLVLGRNHMGYNIGRAPGSHVLFRAPICLPSSRFSSSLAQAFIPDSDVLALLLFFRLGLLCHSPARLVSVSLLSPSLFLFLSLSLSLSLPSSLCSC